MAINDDAGTTLQELQAAKTALIAELAWAALYANAIRKDLVAISAVITKSQTNIAWPEMKGIAEKLRNELQKANRTVGELSDHAGIQRVPINGGTR